MTRIDRFMLWRVGTRVLATILVFYALIVLVEGLDTWRFNYVRDEAGLEWAIVMVLASAGRWTIKTLPITVLLGGIIAFIDLKARHELTVIKSSGLSYWRIVRAPVIGLMIASLGVTAFVENLTTSVVRDLAPTPPNQGAILTPDGEIWVAQETEDGSRYIMGAQHMEPGGAVLHQVSVFPIEGGRDERIEAPTAELRDGTWLLENPVVHTIAGSVAQSEPIALPTNSSAAEIALQLTSIEDITFIELVDLIGAGISDPQVRSAALTRLIRLVALPLTLTGSLLIAFAFTAGYRRSDKYGPAVLFGMVLGFVLFIVTEMSERAGAGGMFDPTFAAIGPAMVTIVVGLTVLLFKEDGRA